MTNSFKQHNDPQLAQTLRNIDQPVTIDAQQLTANLVRKKKRRHHRNVAVVALPIAIAACGFAFSIMATPSTTNHEFAQAPNPSPSVEIARPLLASNTMPDDVLNSFPVDEALEATIRKQRVEIERLKREINSLRQTQNEQSWVLAKEVMSRDLLETSLSGMSPQTLDNTKRHQPEL